MTEYNLGKKLMLTFILFRIGPFISAYNTSHPAHMLVQWHYVIWGRIFQCNHVFHRFNQPPEGTRTNTLQTLSQCMGPVQPAGVRPHSAQVTGRKQNEFMTCTWWQTSWQKLMANIWLVILMWRNYLLKGRCEIWINHWQPKGSWKWSHSLVFSWQLVIGRWLRF